MRVVHGPDWLKKVEFNYTMASGCPVWFNDKTNETQVTLLLGLWKPLEERFIPCRKICDKLYPNSDGNLRLVPFSTLRYPLPDQFFPFNQEIGAALYHLLERRVPEIIDVSESSITIKMSVRGELQNFDAFLRSIVRKLRQTAE